MKKCISALAVILLILAATACTQYQYNWEDFLPGGKTITSEEEFRLFLLDNGSKSARVNVTIDRPYFQQLPYRDQGNEEDLWKDRDCRIKRTSLFFLNCYPPR